MNEEQQRLKEQYRLALLQYLSADGGEAELLRAYDCGQEAVATGLSILDLAATHHAAMLASEFGQLQQRGSRQLYARGEEFLAQSLASFEMTHRGFMEANAALRQLNETLEEQVAKRTEDLERSRTQIQELNERLQRSMAETHHRVKNNLQVIAALVQMQTLDGSEMVPSCEVKRLGQTVNVLAALHDLLTQEARGEARLEYISTQAILDRLLPLMQQMAGDRQVHCRAQDAYVPVKQGTAIAILVNELIANAIKHATGDIELSMDIVADTARLQVCDCGPGFPPSFDPLKAAHTGLELIDTVSRWDLQGQTQYENRPEGGARVTVTFRLSPPIEAVVRDLSEDSSAEPRVVPMTADPQTTKPKI